MKVVGQYCRLMDMDEHQYVVNRKRNRAAYLKLLTLNPHVRKRVTAAAQRRAVIEFNERRLDGFYDDIDRYPTFNGFLITQRKCVQK